MAQNIDQLPIDTQKLWGVYFWYLWEIDHVIRRTHCTNYTREPPQSNKWSSAQATRYYTLHWRHNDHAGVSHHQTHDCLLNRLFRRRSKKTSKLRVTGLCVGNSPGSGKSPHKGLVTRKMFPIDDVIMTLSHHHYETCPCAPTLWYCDMLRRLPYRHGLISFRFDMLTWSCYVKS